MRAERPLTSRDSGGGQDARFVIRDDLRGRSEQDASGAAVDFTRLRRRAGCPIRDPRRSERAERAGCERSGR